ncbi:hypothetical protein D779_2968 [Imhoffiella purpurea]|uniref:Uncharacterized protein n=1 Tax=Imhoffiella purpurea TaxID=1249627 RepID=W9V3M6_9GAMM|nr:hypothetical protein D779_2968 [Imhoffiella purpurea]
MYLGSIAIDRENRSIQVFRNIQTVGTMLLPRIFDQSCRIDH